jgi:hypothetical protein
MNNENLISLGNRTKEERENIGRKGGIKSGESKRKKKSMNELARLIAANQVTSTRGKKKLQALGLSDEDFINDALVTAGVFQAAAAGDIRAVEKWEELTSELQNEQLEKLDAILSDLGGVI